MNSKGNKVVLILVVGLASFTSAMRELNQVRQFGMEASQFIAEWSEKLTPAEIPAAPVVAKVQTCESKQSEPSVELPWLENSVAQEDENADVEVVKQSKATKAGVARVKKARRVDIDPKQFEVRILDAEAGEQDIPTVFEFQQPPVSTFKFKSRSKHSSFRISPRDREILKTLNRSINLRIAS
jgi:hypothetical protein